VLEKPSVFLRLQPCGIPILGAGVDGKETYDVTAKVPPAITREQFQAMLQNLPIERFKIRDRLRCS
jgi:uncharacterized protein (TIGR03435 family)